MPKRTGWADLADPADECGSAAAEDGYGVEWEACEAPANGAPGLKLSKKARKKQRARDRTVMQAADEVCAELSIDVGLARRRADREYCEDRFIGKAIGKQLAYGLSELEVRVVVVYCSGRFGDG